MTITMTAPAILTANNPAQLLVALKDLKNSIIGNTWKKVEVVEDERVLNLLLALLVVPASDDKIDVDMVSETAVIITALGNVGILTLRPLILASTPARIMSLLRDLVHTKSKHLPKMLPVLLRALRNILESTADVVWGHMWGVGIKKRVVGTGLIGLESSSSGESGSIKGKEVERDPSWRREAAKALSLVFEPDNLSTLLTLLEHRSDPQTLLPLYQLFISLLSLPSHRDAITSWSPSDSGSSSASTTTSIPFILSHILNTIALSSPQTTRTLVGQRPNQKLQESALNFLAILIKGQPGLTASIKEWTSESLRVDSDEMEDTDVDDEIDGPEFVGLLSSMLADGTTSVRIAAANCLANIAKGDKGRSSDRVRSMLVNLQLLEVIVKLLRGEGAEERVKLCFILAALVSDDAHLQQCAAEQECPSQIIEIILDLDKDEESGEIGSDLAYRLREAAFIALASLAFQSEPTRTKIAEHNPPFLPYLLRALSHDSYGVRAAACQLARAMSRCAAILRTTLMDSGIGEEIVDVLKREMEARKGVYEIEGAWADGDGCVGGGEEGDVLGERGWTVQEAASATICNLIVDFSPMKVKLIESGVMSILVQLAESPYETVALNALWAVKNALYHSSESTKNDIMSVVTFDALRSFLQPTARQSLRAQALEITQNLLSDGTPQEISHWTEGIGEVFLLDTLEVAIDERSDLELRIPAIYVLSNIALGLDRHRQAIVGRVGVMESLSKALTSKSDHLKIPSLRTLKHLLESPTKPHQKPRQSMVDLLKPYQLKSRLKDLIAGSGSVDVIGCAVGLLEVLERGRER